jgi:hypothetical protein
MRHIPWTAEIFWQAAAECLQQERPTGGVGILEPALGRDDVLPVVAEA